MSRRKGSGDALGGTCILVGVFGFFLTAAVYVDTVDREFRELLLPVKYSGAVDVRGYSVRLKNQGTEGVYVLTFKGGYMINLFPGATFDRKGIGAYTIGVTPALGDPCNGGVLVLENRENRPRPPKPPPVEEAGWLKDGVKSERLRSR